jgi:hypothetical protein
MFNFHTSLKEMYTVYEEYCCSLSSYIYSFWISFSFFSYRTNRLLLAWTVPMSRVISRAENIPLKEALEKLQSI